ncbi:hypothetical protein HDU97_005741 [Phlyctochytrium planicorne]|nr:hypothetical protein HDU97_005741 [Phlyctochytrium planicorne]
MLLHNLVTLTLCTLLLTTTPTTAAITKIVMFGDSASDTGRAQAWTKNNGPVIPSSLFWKGRFSNGPVWIEIVAAAKKVKLTNYAIGGATTSDKLVQGWLGNKFGEPLRSNGGVINVPGVDTQVSEYVQTKESTKKENILYAIWASGNDHFDNDILKLNKTGDYFAKAQYDSWVQLSNAGAKNIMVVIPPPKSLFEIQYGAELIKQAAKFKLLHWKVKFGFFDLPITFAKIVAGSALYGFKGGPDAFCCTNCFAGPPSGKVCADPDSYILWEGIHPSAKVHSIVAEDAISYISSKWGF